MKNPSARIKTCPTATFFTANSTCTGLGWKPDPCGERPATNRQSHGTAFDGSAKKPFRVMLMMPSCEVILFVYFNIVPDLTHSELCAVNV
jgi:hypothetical protein